MLKNSSAGGTAIKGFWTTLTQQRFNSRSPPKKKAGRSSNIDAPLTNEALKFVCRKAPVYLAPWLTNTAMKNVRLQAVCSPRAAEAIEGAPAVGVKYPTTSVPGRSLSRGPAGGPQWGGVAASTLQGVLDAMAKLVHLGPTDPV